MSCHADAGGKIPPPGKRHCEFSQKPTRVEKNAWIAFELTHPKNCRRSEGGHLAAAEKVEKVEKQAPQPSLLVILKIPKGNLVSEDEVEAASASLSNRASGNGEWSTTVNRPPTPPESVMGGADAHGSSNQPSPWVASFPGSPLKSTPLNTFASEPASRRGSEQSKNSIVTTADVKDENTLSPRKRRRLHRGLKDTTEFPLSPETSTFEPAKKAVKLETRFQTNENLLAKFNTSAERRSSDDRTSPIKTPVSKQESPVQLHVATEEHELSPVHAAPDSGETKAIKTEQTLLENGTALEENPPPIRSNSDLSIIDIESAAGGSSAEPAPEDSTATFDRMEINPDPGSDDLIIIEDNKHQESSNQGTQAKDLIPDAPERRDGPFPSEGAPNTANSEKTSEADANTSRNEVQPSTEELVESSAHLPLDNVVPRERLLERPLPHHPRGKDDTRGQNTVSNHFQDIVNFTTNGIAKEEMHQKDVAERQEASPVQSVAKETPPVVSKPQADSMQAPEKDLQAQEPQPDEDIHMNNSQDTFQPFGAIARQSTQGAPTENPKPSAGFQQSSPLTRDNMFSWKISTGRPSPMNLDHDTVSVSQNDSYSETVSPRQTLFPKDYISQMVAHTQKPRDDSSEPETLPYHNTFTPINSPGSVHLKTLQNQSLADSTATNLNKQKISKQRRRRPKVPELSELKHILPAPIGPAHSEDPNPTGSFQTNMLPGPDQVPERNFTITTNSSSEEVAARAPEPSISTQATQHLKNDQTGRPESRSHSYPFLNRRRSHQGVNSKENTASPPQAPPQTWKKPYLVQQSPPDRSHAPVPRLGPHKTPETPDPGTNTVSHMQGPTDLARPIRLEPIQRPQLDHAEIYCRYPPTERPDRTHIVPSQESELRRYSLPGEQTIFSANAPQMANLNKPLHNQIRGVVPFTGGNGPIQQRGSQPSQVYSAPMTPTDQLHSPNRAAFPPFQASIGHHMGPFTGNARGESLPPPPASVEDFAVRQYIEQTKLRVFPPSDSETDFEVVRLGPYLGADSLISKVLGSISGELTIRVAKLRITFTWMPTGVKGRTMAMRLENERKEDAFRHICEEIAKLYPSDEKKTPAVLDVDVLLRENER